jgi:potassium efflux system protein
MGLSQLFRTQLILKGCLLLLLLPGAAAAAAEPETVKPAASMSAESINQVLESALKSERQNLVEIEQSLKRWEQMKQAIMGEVEGYRIQNTAENNLLLLAQPRVEDLEAALNSNQLALRGLSERIDEFEKIGKIASDRINQVADRIAIAEKQKTNLQLENLPEADRQAMTGKLNNLIQVLQEKRQQGESFLGAFDILFDLMKRTQNDLTETRQRLQERLQLRVKSDLTERVTRPFARFGAWSLLDEMATIGERVGAFFRVAFWHQQWINYRRSGTVTHAVFWFLIILVLVFRRKVREYLRTIEMRRQTPDWRYRRLALVILRRSFLLICAALLIWGFDLMKLPRVDVNLSRILGPLVFVLLLTRWGADFLQKGWDGSEAAVPAFLRRRLLQFFRLLRLLAVAFLLLIYLVGADSLLVWIARTVMEIVLFAWVVRFWRDFDRVAAPAAQQEGVLPSSTRLRFLRAGSYLLAGGGLLMELTGYSVLAGHWLASWAETLVLAMWAYIGWQAIHEWYGAAQRAALEEDEEAELVPVAAPVSWFMVQMARMLWLGIVLAGTLMVWSSTAYMIATLGKIINLAFSVGSLEISVKGLLLAVIIIWVTQLAVRIGQKVLREKILDSRDLDRGLRDSIITITTYVAWSLGLLLTLGVLGVNATSLAVVAGALSIGIGFGLQNIFNNFISGLILLFERPIQVGDYVEVNGLWAEVKQINVRATIVQTFDNASVIIPNSDLISQQVTNWSFKDPRMRRQVDVGVAYGSDIELVRKTLLEIAAQTRQILKYPRPDVLFMDHADSALLFRLRFWTHVDNYWSTTTEVRFELDRRFRELGIEIAFPQRDLHIRTVDPRIFAQTTTAAPPASPPEHQTMTDPSSADS